MINLICRNRIRFFLGSDPGQLYPGPQLRTCCVIYARCNGSFLAASVAGGQELTPRGAMGSERRDAPLHLD